MSGRNGRLLPAEAAAGISSKGESRELTGTALADGAPGGRGVRQSVCAGVRLAAGNDPYIRVPSVGCPEGTPSEAVSGSGVQVRQVRGAVQVACTAPRTVDVRGGSCLPPACAGRAASPVAATAAGSAAA